MSVTPKSYCACGQSLPWHLFNLGQEQATAREVATAAAFAKVGGGK